MNQAERLTKLQQLKRARANVCQLESECKRSRHPVKASERIQAQDAGVTAIISDSVVKAPSEGEAVVFAPNQARLI